MAISYELAPIPRWVLINKNGTVAGGAKMKTRRNLNFDQDKPVFKDPFGNEPWTNPIVFDLNGTQGPFYWEVDPANPDDTYFLIVNAADGTELFTIPDYAPAAGAGGGGGGGTINVNIVNYIANNQLISHIDDTANPIGSGNLVIAPSNHKGFTPALVNPIVGTNGGLGADIRFVTNTGIGTPATDQITFPAFLLSDAALSPDVTPVDYVNYECTNNPVGESYKAFQFPICQKVKNLSNQSMTVSVWAKYTGAPSIITLWIRQYFGSGTSASAEERNQVASWTLTTSWVRYNALITIPDVAGKSLGTAGKQTNDDALYLQLQMPLGAACNIQFTKPSLYLGNVNPVTTFETYDQINTIADSPRTGDIRVSMTNAAPNGWLPMNDGSIGNVGSGATLRANMDVFQLYATIYTCVSDTYAPVSGGRTAPGTTTANAVTDFLAGKTLTLTKTLGRALAAAGSGAGLTARALGQALGSEIISIAAMPSHSHPGSTFNFVPDGSVQDGVSAHSSVVAGSTSVSVAPQGGSAADGNMPPVSFMNVFIKT